jgi:hypothetical protein
MRVSFVIAALATLCTDLPVALAAPACDGPCLAVRATPRSRWRPWMFVEANAGMSYLGSAGAAVEGLIGIGAGVGKLRVFAIFETSYSSISVAGTMSGPQIPYQESRGYLDLCGGTRLAFHLGRVAVFGDLLGGGSHLAYELRRAAPSLPKIRSDGWQSILALAVGLQYQPVSFLVLNVRLRVAPYPDPMAELRRAMGIEDSGRLSLTTGVTWYL